MCPHHKKKGKLTDNELRGSAVISSRRSHVERMVLKVKAREIISRASMSKSDFNVADEMLFVTAFLSCLDGPLKFAGGTMKDDATTFMANMLRHPTLAESSDGNSSSSSDGDGSSDGE